MADERATIGFTSLRCIRKREFAGRCEPCLFVDGSEIWHGKMGKGDSVDLNNLAPLEFENGDERFRVTLRERNDKDNDVYDYKLLGTAYLSADSESPATFTTSDTHYDLYYKHT